jgi:hypothetical protein
MWRKWESRLSIFQSVATHELAKELMAVSRELDDNADIVPLDIL